MKKSFKSGSFFTSSFVKYLVLAIALASFLYFDADFLDRFEARIYRAVWFLVAFVIGVIGIFIYYFVFYDENKK